MPNNLVPIAPRGRLSRPMPTDFLYYEAAKIVASVSASKSTIRSSCYNSSFNNKKALFALVSETCKNLKHLEYVVEKSKLLKFERKVFCHLKP